MCGTDHVNRHGDGVCSDAGIGSHRATKANFHSGLGSIRCKFVSRQTIVFHFFLSTKVVEQPLPPYLLPNKIFNAALFYYFHYSPRMIFAASNY
jgi:hypothetical protein